MNCNEIDADVVFDCNKKPSAGQFDEILVFPRRIITAITKNATNPLIVEGITLASGKRAFIYKGDGTLLKRSFVGVKDEFGTRYTHGLPFKVHAADPATMQQLEALAEEREGLMIIGKQNYKGTNGNAKYYILGRDCGVFATISDETGRNIINVMFQSIAENEEPHSPSFLYLTSETVTDALYASYSVAQTP